MFLRFWSNMGSDSRPAITSWNAADLVTAMTGLCRVPAIVAGTRAEQGTRSRDFMEAIISWMPSQHWRVQFAALRVFITGRKAHRIDWYGVGGPLDKTLTLITRTCRAPRLRRPGLSL